MSEQDRPVAALGLLRIQWGRLPSSQIGSTECNCLDRTRNGSRPQLHVGCLLFIHSARICKLPLAGYQEESGNEKDLPSFFK